MKKKKIIKIAHLYYDLMNLFGESGNVRAFKKFAERQGAEVEVYFLTIGDDIDFMAYDFYYIGGGSEKSQSLVLEDLWKYRDAIKDSIEAGKMFLATGNSMELFGQKIRPRVGKNIKCLGLFEYHAYQTERRLVSEILYACRWMPEGRGRNILGFRNCRCNIINNNQRMFGFANNINYKNFFGMTFVGPFLVRNPYFTNMMIERLFEEKGYEYHEIIDTIEFKAYHEYVLNFIINSDLD